MSYLLEKVSGAYVGGNSINVSPTVNGSWEDGPSSAVAASPQTVNTSFGDGGFVDSVSVDFTGGEEIGPNGVGTGVTSVSFGAARIDFEADGFPPNSDVTVRSVGPAGADTYTTQTNSAGVVTNTAAMKASGASFQPGGSVPSGSFTISNSQRTAAELGVVPGPLWGDLYYALEGRFGGSAQLIRTYPVWKHGGTVKWIIGVYLPPRDIYNEAHKAYSDVVYVGPVDTHVEIPDDTPAARALMQGEEYKLHFNAYDRLDGYKAKPGDAVFIRPVGYQANIEMTLDSLWYHRRQRSMAYIIKSDGTFVRGTEHVASGIARATLKQGEILIISSVRLGGNKKYPNRVYPWGTNPEGGAIISNEDGWHPIPSRAKIFRKAGSNTYASTFLKPGQLRMRLQVS